MTRNPIPTRGAALAALVLALGLGTPARAEAQVKPAEKKPATAAMPAEKSLYRGSAERMPLPLSSMTSSNGST
jgi:hypothetical protein